MLTSDPIVPKFGGRTSVELNDAFVLQEEGRCMRHCVGSYAPICLSGRSRIFSLRDQADRPLATIELGSGDGNRWQVLQVMGIRNRPVDDMIAAVARKLADQVNAGASGDTP